MEGELNGFRQFDETYDLYCPTGPTSFYAICSTPRSGSHYLGHLMLSTGALGSPLEYFHPEHFRKWTELAIEAGAADTIRYIKSRRTSLNGYFGFKARFLDFSGAFSEPWFEEAFPGCRLLYIEREDLLGQAISLVRAHQNNQWISMHSQSGETRYDFEAIDRAILQLLEEKASWHRFFAVTGREYRRVTYESLTADPVSAIGAVAGYLGIESVTIDFEKPIPRKQADAESAEWRDRFRNEAHSRSPRYACERCEIVAG